MRDSLIGLFERVFRMTCRLYPSEFKQRLGRDLRSTFVAECEKAHARGGVPHLLWYGVTNIVATPGAALAECLKTDEYRTDSKRGSTLVSGLWQDVRVAVRALLRAPGFTAAALLTMVLGIGMTGAIASLVYSVAMRPLPYQDPERLVRVFQQSGPTNRWSVSVVDYQAIEEHQRTFDGLGALVSRDVTLTGRGDPQRVRVGWATAGLFRAFGITAAQGRVFEPAIDDGAEDNVVVLSHAFHERYFGSEDAIGGTITLDGTTYTVIGVTAPGLQSLAGSVADVWPLVSLPIPTRRGPFFIQAIGRLRTGVSLEDATRDLARISKQIFPIWAQGFQDTEARLTPVPMREVILGDIDDTMVLAIGGVGLLLLITIANLTNLMLVRASTRERELALRASLGASRSRIFRQLLTENVVLAAAGGSVGLVLAVWGLRAFIMLEPTLPRLDEVGLHGPGVLFTLLVTLVCGIVPGLLPILQGIRDNPADALRGGRGAGSETVGWQRVRGGLVSAEFALALPLVVGAVVLATSLVRLLAVDPGFDPAPLSTARVALPTGSYSGPAAVRDFWDGMLPRINELPGVAGAAVSSSMPPDQPANLNNFDLADRPVPPGTTQPSVPWVMASPEFFDVMSVPLLTGRLPNAFDTVDAPEVVVVSRAWAERFYPDEDPIGKLVYAGGCTAETCEPITVVGVVGNVKYLGLRRGDEAVVFQPFAQFPWRSGNLIARTEGASGDVMARVRAEIHEVDPSLPVTDVGPMSDRFWASVAQPRFWATLAGLFGLVGAVLAAIGIYGVLSFHVSRQTRDIGVRMALGATPSAVRGLVLRRGLTQAGVGLAVGLLGTIALARLLEGLLFGISATNVLVLTLVATGMAVVAIVACYGPARRATRVDPVRALGAE